MTETISTPTTEITPPILTKEELRRQKIGIINTNI